MLKAEFPDYDGECVGDEAICDALKTFSKVAGAASYLTDRIEEELAAAPQFFTCSAQALLDVAATLLVMTMSVS